MNEAKSNPGSGSKAGERNSDADTQTLQASDEQTNPKHDIQDRNQKAQNHHATQQEPVNFGSDVGQTTHSSENNFARRSGQGSNEVDEGASSNNAVGNLDDSTVGFRRHAHDISSSNGLSGFGNVFNGGMGMMNRRGSVASLGMDDFFAGFGGGMSRRGSMAGFDTLGNVDSLFGPMGLRRDSIDTTTATLDAAVLDLQRRRYSMGLPPFQQDSNLGGSGVGLNSFSGLQNNAAAGVANLQDVSSLMQRDNGPPQDSIAARQAQLQAQQRELEMKQKQLELERQRLVENMRQRNFSGSNTLHTDRNRLAMLEMESLNMNRRPSLAYSGGDRLLGGTGSGPMGLSSNSQLPNVSLDQSGKSLNNPYFQNSQQQGLDGSGTGSAQSSRNWHICQFCNSKAFASLDEALAHESICFENPNRNNFLNAGSGLGGHGGQAGVMSMPFFNNQGMNFFDRRHQSIGLGDSMMHPPLLHPNENLSRNFPLGLDTSQRSTLSLGMGGNFQGNVDGHRMPRGLSIGMNSLVGLDVSQRSVLSMGTGMDHSQRSALTMDESNHSLIPTALSNGPFTMLQLPMPLAMDSDKDWLTPLHCFVRRHCVEVFTATDDDVATPSKGKRKPIHVGQIGIRCPHCHQFGISSSKARERGSVYYPTTIKSIYNATMNLLQRHLHSCPAVPEEIMRRYETLKADDARSGTSKRYWEESALSLGLVDTHNGIRFSALTPPPLPTLTLQQESTSQNQAGRSYNEFFSTKSNAVGESTGPGEDSAPGPKSNEHNEEESTFENNENPIMNQIDRCTMSDARPLVTPEDKPFSTLFSYHLLGQMQPCVFTEADRLGKRKGLPPGFPGLACRHCFGGYGSGRFFPSSIKTLSDTSKTLNVLHNHMMRCRKCPADVRETLDKLRGSHDEERAKMKFGSQKAFFARIWERLHGKTGGTMKRPFSDGRSDNDEDDLEDGQQLPTGSDNRSSSNASPHTPKPTAKRSNIRKSPTKQQQLKAQQQHVTPPTQGPPTLGVGGNEGLDALAAVSTPSKRQKV